MPITYPPDITVDAFTDPLVEDSHERQDKLRARQRRAAQRSSSSGGVKNRVVRRWCGVDALWLEIGLARSTSYSLTRAKHGGYWRSDRAHPPVLGGAHPRFHFVPGDPSDATPGTGGEVCTIKYTLHKPTRIKVARLELFRTDDPRPLMSVKLDYDKVHRRLAPRDVAGPVRLQGNDLIWDGRLDRNRSRVGGRVIDIHSSPYKLKLSVTPKRGVWRRGGEAWTYFDVRVDSLALEWGEDAVIPLHRADVDARFEADVRAHEVALLQDLVANATVGGGRVIDANDHRLRLPSNLFSTDLDGQSATDLPFRTYREMWGDGPLLPIYAAINLARSDGATVDARAAAWALGKAEFLWDWEDEPATKVAQWAAAAPQRTRDYLTHTLDYLVALEEREGQAPPGSNNCHVNHGGKRGRGARPVFPAQTPINYTDLTAALIPNEFQFEVEALAERRWAARSRPRTAGVSAGLTGVMFQPSRIAGDRYRVAVYLVPRATIPWAETAANLRASTLPHAVTGVFEIWRRINAWVYRADGTVGDVNLATVRGVFAEACVEIEAPATAAVHTGRWKRAFVEGLVDYMIYQSKAWFGVMLRNRQAGPDCVQMGDHADPRGHARKLANAGLWEVQVRGAVDDGSLRPGEPVVHQATNTRGFVVHREQFGGDYLIYVRHALGQHLGPGQALRILRGPIDVNVVAAQRRNAGHGKRALRTKLEALCDPSLTAMAYSQASKGISTRVMSKYADIAHAGAKGVFFFIFRQMATHAGEPRAGGTNSSIASETRSFAYLQDDPAVAGGGPLKAFDLVAAHELGHALFLPHAPHEGDAKTSVHLEVPGGEHDNCIMNYHTTSAHFCGMCMLRLMGWSIHGASEVANNDRRLLKLSNQDRNRKLDFAMITLTATMPVTPPRTVRPLQNSTNLNVPIRTTVDGRDTSDLTANGPVVLLTGSAGPAPAPALADGRRQAVCGPLRLEASAQMPDGARYVWRVVRAADDHAQVRIASPNALPTFRSSGPNNEFLEVETDATGTFHIKASVDVAGGANFDDAAEFLCVNLVLVKVERIESNHKFKQRNGGCWLNGGDMMVGTQQNGQAVPVKFQTKIKLIGGGNDGKRGLDKVSGGWINNIRSDVTGAHYTANDGSGATREAHTLALHRDGAGAAWTRLNPAPGDGAALVDKHEATTAMTNWTARHAILSAAHPSPHDGLLGHLTAKPIGGHCWITAEDAPAQGWDIHPPTLVNYDIDRLWVRTKFTAYLCLWTHSAPCLIGVVEEHPWEVEGDYDVDLHGRRHTRTRMRITALAKTKHDTLVDAISTEVEWCPPGTLSSYIPRHFPAPETPAADLGFSWANPAVR